MDKHVLVVGGAGYIGSHMVKMLCTNGYRVIVLDDLSSGYRDAIWRNATFIRGSIQDSILLDKILGAYPIDGVMHFASYIQVGESVRSPDRYYLNNVANTINLLNAMARHQVKNLVFSSTAAIFGQPLYTPIDELHPMSPINPYGRSKWMIEQLLKDYERAFAIRAICLRYFNAAGADPSGHLGERHEPETHLIPLAIRAAIGKSRAFALYGNDYPTPDGTCVRDYVHVSDLCTAHLLALARLRDGLGSDVFNLGNGNGYSVNEVLRTVSQVTKSRFDIQLMPKREGDPATLVADARKAKSILGWRPCYQELGEIITHAYNWEISLGEKAA